MYRGRKKTERRLATLMGHRDYHSGKYYKLNKDELKTAHKLLSEMYNIDPELMQAYWEEFGKFWNDWRENSKKFKAQNSRMIKEEHEAEEFLIDNARSMKRQQSFHPNLSSKDKRKTSRDLLSNRNSRKIKKKKSIKNRSRSSSGGSSLKKPLSIKSRKLHGMTRSDIRHRNTHLLNQISR